MKKLPRPLKVTARLIVSAALLVFLFLLIFCTILSPPLQLKKRLIFELVKISILILLALICPRSLRKPGEKAQLVVDAKKALTFSAIWLTLMICIFWLSMQKFSGLNVFLAILSIGAIFLLAVALNHKILLQLYLIAIFALLFCFLTLCSDPIFSAISAIFALLCATVFASSQRLAGIKSVIPIIMYALLFYLYYKLDYVLPLLIVLFIILSVPFLSFTSLLNKGNYPSRVVSFVLSANNMLALLSIVSILSFIALPSSPVQTSIVKLQKGSEVLLHPKKMSYSVRVFIPQKDKWLAIINSFKLKSTSDSHQNKGLLLTMLDKEGNIMKPTLSVGRIDDIQRLKSRPNIIFVLGLNGNLACAFDTSAWKVVACAEDNWVNGHVAISPDDRFVAIYDDPEKTQPKFYKLEDAIFEGNRNKVLKALDASEIIEDGCCSGDLIKFIGNNRLIIHDSKIRFENPIMEGKLRKPYQTFYIVEIRESRPKISSKIKDYLNFKWVYNFAFSPENPDMIYVPIFFNPKAFGGGVEIVNLEEKKVEKFIGNPLMTGLRVLVYVPELELYCAASEFGLLFILNKDLKIKKTLYCGAHIRDIYVEGSELFFASQAGLIKFNLKDIRL